jgi:hypothetical protein
VDCVGSHRAIAAEGKSLMRWRLGVAGHGHRRPCQEHAENSSANTVCCHFFLSQFSASVYLIHQD